ncbi:MAG TPA: hypothetical protein PK819_12845 [Thermomicrobiales bacterium]|nr:hypothetical protein [Thermomicrobiales bacterium]
MESLTSKWWPIAFMAWLPLRQAAGSMVDMHAHTAVSAIQAPCKKSINRKTLIRRLSIAIFRFVSPCLKLA